MNETLKRTISGAVYVLLLIASILYSKESFFIIFGIFLIIAIYEYCTLVEIKKTIPILLGFIFYGLITTFSFYKEFTQRILLWLTHKQLVFTSISDTLFYKTLLGITIFTSFKCINFLFNDRIQKITPYNKFIYLVGYIILPFIFIPMISCGKNGPYNYQIILGLFLLIWTNDTFAYLVGKSIGKHKLLERISPKKTIEGFVGGLVFTILAAYLYSKYFIHAENTVILNWTIIATIVGIIGTIGDLIESKFKRIAGVKDSGKIMPGHGGILDRLDSVIFVAPFVLLFFKILYYVS